MYSSQKNSDTTLKISLKNIAANYKLIQNKLAKKSIAAAVVKANAYGLGAKKVAEKLADSGCKSFFVANIDEAIELREVIKKHKIYVFHGVRKNQEKLFQQFNIQPVINTIDEALNWQHYCHKINKKLPFSLHIDTGMNRLGIPFPQLEKNLRKIDFAPEFLLSHMASADDAKSEFNKTQLKKFNHARRFFPEAKYSLANSSASFLAECYHFDMVRPGSALYGINPSSGKNPLKQVVNLESKIIQVREIDSAGTVGYGATHKVKKGDKIAVIPVGYADGFSRILSNNGKVFIENHQADIVGRVSMDLVTIDVTKIPEKLLNIGKKVEIIGKNITVDDIARQCNTIGYEILTNLGNRFKIEYAD